MKLILLLLLLFPVAVIADEIVVGQLTSPCQLERSEYVRRAVDVFARHHYNVTFADRELGIVRAERVEQERRGAHRIVTAHTSVDGDSIRITLSEVVTGGAGTIAHPLTAELVNPVVEALRSMCAMVTPSQGRR